ncbi:RNA-binding protein 12-like [Schistocerca americana]|uniref:RNA-binding protein 12-like n=1 Tax=Schistocerca americana TaxID=7009 RepID=UPI001F4FE008|nr:RNA-binding protein 12-like [Schistocerca americana]
MVRQGRTSTRPRPLDFGDPRTPMAWQHRNLNYQHQNVYSDNSGAVHSAKEVAGIYREPSLDPYTQTAATHSASKDLHYMVQPQMQSKSVPPSTDISSSSSCSDEPDTESCQKYNGTVPVQPMATWDGEPCPVHHCLGVMSPLPIAMPVPVPVPLPPPAVLVPAPHGPHPLMLQAASPAPSPAPLLPLPVREHLPAVQLAPTNKAAVNSHKCAGKAIVLWIVFAVVVVGIILAIILKFVRI